MSREQLDRQGEDPADGRRSGPRTSWEQSDQQTEELEDGGEAGQTSRTSREAREVAEEGGHKHGTGHTGDRTDTAANTRGVRTVVCGPGCPTCTDGGGRGTGAFRDSGASGTTGL